MTLMTAGIAVMIGAAVLSVIKLVPVVGECSLADWSFAAIAAAYGAMMFASSFVEEEHHFWYWTASGWFMALFLKEYVVSQSRYKGFTC